MTKKEYREPLQHLLKEVWLEINRENIEKEQAYHTQLKEVNKKIYAIEEKHYVKDEMNKEAFEKFYLRLMPSAQISLMNWRRLP